MSFWSDLFGNGEPKPEASMPGQSQMTVQLLTQKPLTLDETLEYSWDYVQRMLMCYELPYPKIQENLAVETACISMADHQIMVNKGFVDDLSKRGLDHETILKGLLSHEAGHYKIIPWDLKNHLLMIHTAKKICGDNCQVVTNYFTDVSLNLELMLAKGEHSIQSIYAALDKESRVDNLLSHLYTAKTRLDFNSPILPIDLNRKLMELSKIRYTDRKKTFANLRRFARIIKDVIEEDRKQDKKDACASIDDFGIGSYSKDEMRRALKEIAKETEDVSSYKEIYGLAKELEAKNGTKEGTDPKRSVGAAPVSASKDPVNLDALISFYTAKSENYQMNIEDREILGGGSSDARSELKEWEISDTHVNVDVFNSYGKYIPSISKAWNEAETTGEKPYNATPDLYIMIDSSGSMPDPSEFQSNAVLGAICAAKQYLKKGSMVAVANFSSKTKCLGFCTDYDNVAKSILYYQEGGTVLDNNKVEQAVKAHSKEVDLMLLTDGGIYNLDDVIKGFEKARNMHRVTILEIDRSGLSAFSGLQSHGKVEVYQIGDEKDIPKVMVHDMAKGGVL